MTEWSKVERRHERENRKVGTGKMMWLLLFHQHKLYECHVSDRVDLTGAYELIFRTLWSDSAQ